MAQVSVIIDPEKATNSPQQLKFKNRKVNTMWLAVYCGLTRLGVRENYVAYLKLA